MAKWTMYHPAVFFLTFFAYAFFHAVRKTLSNVKSTISDEWTPCSSSSNEGANETETETETGPLGCTPADTTWSRQRSSSSFFPDREAAEGFLGTVDASFLFAYALGLYVSGFIADRQDLRLVLSAGMVLSAAVAFVFGPVLQWGGAYSRPACVGLMVLGGLLQSTGWPCVVAVMGNWFGKGGSRGLVLGLWGSTASVGNIIGALLVSAVVDYGFEYAFLLTSCMLFAGGVVIFFGLVPTPHELGLPLADEKEGDGVVDIDTQMTVTYIVETASGEDKTVQTSPRSETNQVGETDRASGAGPHKDSAPQDQPSDVSNVTERSHEQYDTFGLQHSSAQRAAAGTVPEPPAAEAAEADPKRPKAVSFLTAVFLPGVIPYSLAYAFLKTVNYAFFFWLPFYLSEAYGWRQATADRLSTWYDVGGIAGGTAAGFVSDRCGGKRTVVVAPMLALGIPVLYAYGTVSAGGAMLSNAAMLCCCGFLIGGASNLISAAIAADLGRQEALAGDGGEALSTVTGIVDGSGSLGAAAGQVAVPHLQLGFGWRSVFYFFMAAVLLTVVCILPIFVGEVKLLAQRWRRRREDVQK